MGNTWRKSDKFGSQKRERENRKNRKRMKKLAKKHGCLQTVEEDYNEDYESQYGEEDVRNY